MDNIQKVLMEELKNDNSLYKIQEYISQIMKIRGFSDQTSEAKMLLLIEEVGELAKAIRKNQRCLAIDYSKIDSYDTVESEIADVFIVLVSICDLLKINLFDAFMSKEESNVKRIWSEMND